MDSDPTFLARWCFPTSRPTPKGESSFGPRRTSGSGSYVTVRSQQKAPPAQHVRDVPPELRKLPGGLYVVEAVEEQAPELAAEEGRRRSGA